jgi:PITH domain
MRLLFFDFSEPNGKESFIFKCKHFTLYTKISVECNMASHDECTGHTHDHGESDDEGVSLRQYIDFPLVQCLNETANDSGRSILKLYEDRMTVEPSLVSAEDDPELLLYIPFTEAINIHSLSIHNSSNSSEHFSPRRVKLFTNRDNLDFETARELPPQMELELMTNPVVPLVVSKVSAVLRFFLLTTIAMIMIHQQKLLSLV